MPYILIIVGSVLFPTNNLLLIFAMIATSEGLGSFSYAIKKWGLKCKHKLRQKDGRKTTSNKNYNDPLNRYIA